MALSTTPSTAAAPAKADPERELGVDGTNCDGEPREPGAEKDPGPPVVVEDIHIAFGEKVVLDGVSLAIERGETVAILGESGGGKSLLLKVMLGIQVPDKGRVRLFGTDIKDKTDDDLEPLRRRLSVVYQGSALFSGMSVEENVALELREILKLPEDEIEKRVKESLDAAGLEDVDRKLLPDELSGGMKKRLAVARAIAPRPEVIFYDEPTSGLDPINSARVLELIQGLHKKAAATSVVVTHDLRGARKIASRLVLLAGGHIVFDGTPDEFMKSEDKDVIAYRAAVAAVVDPPTSASRAAPGRAAEAAADGPREATSETRRAPAAARADAAPGQKAAAQPSARKSLPAR